MNDFLQLVKLLFLLLLLILIFPLVMAINWAIFGAFGYFWFFFRLIMVKDKNEPKWWHFPATVCWFLVYWLVCKKFGMLGVVIPAILHALQGAQ
jgi:hypothetical protein